MGRPRKLPAPARKGIAPELAPFVRPHESLTPHPRNPRRGDIDAITSSLQRFGQVRPILVDADGVILAGNHIWRAAALLGWDEVAAITFDGTPEEATAYLLADNRTSDLGDYHDPLLAELLAELRALDSLAGVGYSEADVDKLIASVAYVEPDAPEPAALDPTTLDVQHRCPACGYEWSGASA